jgi:hypothetical protein
MVPKMLNRMRVIAALAFFPGLIPSQSIRAQYLDHARIQHSNSWATVVANDSIPLFQAIYAVRLEYGWQINWESAPSYSRFDLVDVTDSEWRAAHPYEKGATRPSGGLFTGTFPEPKEASDPDAERLVLEKLIQEYNATDNPGKYVLRVDSDGQFTVVGTRVRGETGALQEIRPLLDTPVTLAKEPRNVHDAIKSILSTLESATGRKVIFAAASSSLFMTTQVTMGGERVPARELLRQALAATKQPIQYGLFFNPDVPVYVLNVSPAMKAESDGHGGERLAPVDRVAKP